MKFRFLADINVAVVTLSERETADEVPIDTVVVSIDADGEIVDLELTDARAFGDPFDEAAAERAVAWAREQLHTHVSA
jgi:hypothetical protein